MKKIALLLAVVVYAASLTGCGCFRRVRGAICPGAYCGSRTPILGSLRAPQPIAVTPPTPIVTAPPMVAAPQVYQPQVVAPNCASCQPVCACPPQVCDPCCESYGTSYGGDCCGGYYGGCAGGECCQDQCGSVNYGGGFATGCDSCSNGAPFGINVPDGEYLGGIETSDSGWGNTPTDAGTATDPSPAN